MPFDIGSIGQAAANTVSQGMLGQAMGLVLEHHNDQRQLRQQNALQQLQIQGQEQLTDYNYNKQMELWHATNYGAQIGELQKAGLNPGLLYAKGGPGGQTGIQQGSVSGGQAQQNPGESQALIGMGLQFQNMAAQRDLLKAQQSLAEAQARNTDADTANKPKVGANIESSTQLNLANTDNAKANTELQRIQTELLSIQTRLAGATLQDQITLVGQTVEKTAAEIKQIALNNQLNEETMNARIKMATAQLLGQYLQNNLTTAQTGQAQAQTKELGARATAELAQGHAALQNAITMIDQVWGSAKDGKTIQEHWNAIQKNYTEKLINLGIGAEAIQGIGQILDHIPALNLSKGIPRGTTPPPVQGFRSNY